MGRESVERDDTCAWIIGFSTNLDCCTTEEADQWGFVYDLKMVWETG